MATKSELVQKIVDKADSDGEFRKQLIADPGAAIKSMGMTTRANVKVKVLVETEDEGFIVLPFRAAAGEGGDLSDAALGGVTGGASRSCPVCGAG